MGDAFYLALNLVAFLVQFLPQDVLQHVDAEARDGGDEHVRHVFGQGRLYLVHQFLVQHVALGDGQYALLVQHFGVEVL